MNTLSRVLRRIQLDEEVKSSFVDDNRETRRIHDKLGYFPENADPATKKKWGLWSTYNLKRRPS